MTNSKTLRVLRDPVGWTVEGDRQPRSYVEKTRAIERAETLARQGPSSRVEILDELGEVEEERHYG
jgi:hypothetical protein